MTSIKTTLFFSLFMASLFAQASVQGETSYELMCRAKAKEIAADTYRGCVSENRNAEIDKLKKDYQERLRSLKDDYEKEIDKIGGKHSASTSSAKSSKKMVAAAKVPKKASADADVMAVESAPVSRESMSDDSMMDLPEPIPVENIQRN